MIDNRSQLAYAVNVAVMQRLSTHRFRKRTLLGNEARVVRDRYAVTTAANPRYTRHSMTTDAEYVGQPNCEKCGTDEFIYLESFVPPKHRQDGTVRKLGEVAYTCTRCEDFSAHSVPASWAPPGWYLG
jgi:hypothetical protein